MAVSSPRASERRNYAVVPYWDEEDPSAFKEWIRDLAQSVNGVYDGATNAIGSVTLTANSTTTTLTDVRIGIDSVIHLTATTENARVLGSPGYTNATDGSVTLIHASDAATDQTYGYSLHG